MRIMLVEDDALVALDLADLLRELGHDVAGPYSTVRSALAGCRSGAVDFAILDFNLGQETSAPIADELTARGLPFTFVTGYRRASLPDAYRDAPLLSKPVSTRALAEAIARATDGMR